MAGARAYECVYCHDLDRSHAINDVTKKKCAASEKVVVYHSHVGRADVTLRMFPKHRTVST